MADEFEEIEDKVIKNSPETDKHIQNFIEGKFEATDEPESFEDPMSPLSQINKVKADYHKRHPGVDLIIARAVRDRNKI